MAESGVGRFFWLTNSPPDRLSDTVYTAGITRDLAAFPAPLSSPT